MLELDNKPLPRRRPRRAVERLACVAVENAGGAVHGTVMVGVLLAAEDSHREGYPETIGAAAVVLALYWLMSLYTHTLGIRLRTRGRLSRGCSGTAVRTNWPWSRGRSFRSWRC
jgi:hypothetical protein